MNSVSLSPPTASPQEGNASQRSLRETWHQLPDFTGMVRLEDQRMSARAPCCIAAAPAAPVSAGMNAGSAPRRFHSPCTA